MKYSPLPPYEILSNKLIDFPMMQRLRRFARYWDLTANSGNFVDTVPLLWSGDRSPFWSFLAFADWLHGRIRRTHQIALATLAEALFDFLVERGDSREFLLDTLERDWRRVGRKEELPFIARQRSPQPNVSRASNAPKRQSRHLVTS
jgi:hypothetical protein